MFVKAVTWTTGVFVFKLLSRVVVISAPTQPVSKSLVNPRTFPFPAPSYSMLMYLLMLNIIVSENTNIYVSMIQDFMTKQLHQWVVGVVETQHHQSIK